MNQPQQLPGPNADLWDWQMHGCAGVSTRRCSSTPTGNAAAPAPTENCRPRRCAGGARSSPSAARTHYRSASRTESGVA